MTFSADNFEGEIMANSIAMVIRGQVEAAGPFEGVHVYMYASVYGGITISLTSENYNNKNVDPKVKAAMVKIRKAIGGEWDKGADGFSFTLTRRITPEVRCTISAYRELVCTPRVTGTQQVEKQVAVEYETQIVTEDIIEWDCPPSLR
jgi:hypothetical protein